MWKKKINKFNAEKVNIKKGEVELKIIVYFFFSKGGKKRG